MWMSDVLAEADTISCCGVAGNTVDQRLFVL